MKTQIRKNHREEERKSTLICEVSELERFFVPGLVLGFLGPSKKMKKIPFSLEVVNLGPV